MKRLKIYTDENVDIGVSTGLRKRGIKVFSTIEKGLVGIPDIEHFKNASDKKAVIFTHDHHFLEIAKVFTKKGKTHWGVIFVQMNKLSVGECIKRLSLYADILSAAHLSTHFFVFCNDSCVYIFPTN